MSTDAAAAADRLEAWATNPAFWPESAESVDVVALVAGFRAAVLAVIIGILARSPESGETRNGEQP